MWERVMKLGDQAFERTSWEGCCQVGLADAEITYLSFRT
jgi:hypothetical protein